MATGNNMDGMQMDEGALVKQLQETLNRLPNDIPVYLFSTPGKDDIFTQGCRQVVQAFQNLSSKIKFQELTLDHELARKWKVESHPTLLLAPERYRIRWLGAPLGEEGRSFLEAVILLGLGDSRLNEQSRQIVQKIDEPRNVKIFVSPTCPYCPQQVVNGIKAVIEKPEYISLEIIDIQARQDLAEKYSAHSVPQAYANEKLIGQGAQQEELFMSSLQLLEPQTVFIPESTEELISNDLVIVGGGPAGLTAGIYAVRSGLKAALVEKDALGGQVALTPVVENYTGFTQVGGKTLVDIMVSHALEYVQIFKSEPVLDIKPGDPIQVTTSRRVFETRAVLLATGAAHRKLNVPGEQRLAGRGVSYCATCDGPLFKNKKVLMVGGGNSAVTEALHLSHMGVDVTVVHRRQSLRAQDMLTQRLEEAAIPVLWNTEIKEIAGDSKVQSVVLVNNRTGKSQILKVDGVFISIGFTPAVELAGKIGVELTAEGYIKHDEHYRTNIDGIYCAGDVSGGYKQIVVAAGQGSAAAMTIFEDLVNPYWKK